MPEDTGKYIRIPVATARPGHRIRTIIVSRQDGIKALYETDDNKIITNIFDKSKGWTMESAQERVKNQKRIKECTPISVDQMPNDFVKLCVKFTDDTEEVYAISNGVPFTMTEEMIKEDEAMIYLHKNEAAGDQEDKAKTKAVYCPNCGWNGEGDKPGDCPDCGSRTRRRGKPRENDDEDEDKGCGGGGGGGRKKPRVKEEKAEEEVEITKDIILDENTGENATPDLNQAMEIIKTDKLKQIVYGVFLWPDKADHDGDIISADDIEKVAHKFIVEYREIDEMHKRETTDADIVESFVAWKDNLEYYGKMLKQGAWAGAIHIQNKDVWAKVEKGEYRGFSVRITGTRTPVGENNGGQE